MARDYTTEGLIESIKRRGNFPVNQSTFTAEQILGFADDSILDTVLPMIREARGDHFVTYTDVTTTSSLAYDIPTEAMNRALHNVCMVDSSGREFALIAINLDRELDIASWWSGIDRSTYRRAYYVRGDQIFLYPDVQVGETLRLYYERLPNRLIETSSAAEVVSVNTSTGAITCTTGTVPTSVILTTTPVCVVKGTPGFTLRLEALTPTAVTTSIVTLGGAAQIAVVAAAGIEAGDWICLDGDSPIVQLPVEAHPILAQKVAMKCLEAMGDEYIQVARQEWDAVRNAYRASFPKRVEQAPHRVFGRNRLMDFVRH